MKYFCSKVREPLCMHSLCRTARILPKLAKYVSGPSSSSWMPVSSLVFYAYNGTRCTGSVWYVPQQFTLETNSGPRKQKTSEITGVPIGMYGLLVGCAYTEPCENEAEPCISVISWNEWIIQANLALISTVARAHINIWFFVFAGYIYLF